MGSVSSVINGNNLTSKHCKNTEHRLKEGMANHGKSGGCSLDGLLKCSFTQCSSSSANPSKGLSHSRSGRSEDFFYIKVSQKPRSMYPRERSTEELVSRDEESDWRIQPKLMLMPGNMSERTSAEKSSVHSTAFKPLNATRTSSSEKSHHSLDHILCPPRTARGTNTKQKQDTLGTCSDSGRNSMSSLPTHSTSGSLTASTGPVSNCDGSLAHADSLSKGSRPNFPPWVNVNGGDLDCSYRAALNNSVSASKANEDTAFLLSAEEPGHVSKSAGGIRSPITTDESLIEHLEQRLLERETEMQGVQVSFEEKEAGGCQPFMERQKHCAKDMEGLKQQSSTKLQQASQMASKTHQALQLQVSQLQAEKVKLQEDISKISREKDLIESRLKACETQSTLLCPTLEETQWEVCQKTGEISLLKQQLRDCQADVGHKLNEIVNLRTSLRENAAKMEMLEKQNKDQEERLHSCTIEVEVCQNELQRKRNEADFLREKVSKLEKDLVEIKEDLVTAKEQRLHNNLQQGAHSQTQTLEGINPGSDCVEQSQREKTKEHISTEFLQNEVETLRQQLREGKSAQEKLASSFEHERQTWNKEKDRVIKYQKQLQINYLQMHKKNQDLDRILKELTAELESRTKLGMDIPYSSGLQTYDDVIATEI
ncbi:leucine zipper putative tumor suppressor 1 [Gouania willdenowi]|uniref:Leucine zipper putative tumor suppressor 1-like n=1 Tax=Gouania willdenowi TaxID=441366 RepID=A0A8C5D875_GOUWI|nr:leucine zipper putative tumor suppressor 1-like [Gouania willdenowi]XP_028314193.1 leucine zipper putative tumor suppressor 1-like [Gouania willdenowi]XP_028314194.1 leucine zipper putative tumor suppressor 1-like [Gouania willdenowi]